MKACKFKNFIIGQLMKEMHFEKCQKSLQICGELIYSSYKDNYETNYDKKFGNWWKIWAKNMKDKKREVLTH